MIFVKEKENENNTILIVWLCLWRPEHYVTQCWCSFFLKEVVENFLLQIIHSQALFSTTAFYGGKDATPSHVFQWKLECHIFKYGIYLHLTTKSRPLSFTLQREIFSFKKKQASSYGLWESSKKNLVDFESHMVQSVTLFNEFFFFLPFYFTQKLTYFGTTTY